MNDKNLSAFAAALDEGFRSGGWPAALRGAIKVSIAQRDAKTNYLVAFWIAQLYAELGDKDHAFEWLNTAYQEHNLWIPTLRTDFTLAPLHSDPRYTDLVRKLGFPQEVSATGSCGTGRVGPTLRSTPSTLSSACRLGKTGCPISRVLCENWGF